VIHPNDHRPAHAHVIGRGRECIFKLNSFEGPVEPQENYGFSRREIGSIRSAVTRRLDEPCRAWDFMASYDDFEMANRRAKDLQARMPRVISARYDRKTARIVLSLNSSLIVSVAPSDAEGLEDAPAFSTGKD
jgi:Domain of unknown function (DUF4160)